MTYSTPRDAAQTPRYVGEAEVERLTSLSRRTLQQWRIRRKGPRFYKIGARVLYDQAEVLAWIQSKAIGGQHA